MVPAKFKLLIVTDLRMSVCWPCGATSKTWHNVDATPFLRAMGVDRPNVSATMTVELTLRSATELSLDLRNFDVKFLGASVGWDTAMWSAGVDDADCYPGPLPIEMTQLIQGACA